MSVLDEWERVPVKIEAAFGADHEADPATWVWTDLTDRAFVGGSPSAVAITRGRQDEQSQVQTSEASVVLDNQDGALTPESGASPFYPYVQLGTPVRVVADDPTLPVGLALRPGAYAYADAFHSTLRVTGDLDVRFQATLDSWRSAQYLAARWHTIGANRSWVLYVTADGYLALRVSADGTATLGTFTSTATVPVTSGRYAVRVTLDVNNGSGGRTATFYAGPDIDSLAQLGAAVTQAGTTALASADSATLVAGGGQAGNENISGLSRATGMVELLQMRSGIGGTIVADADFTSATPGVLWYTDGVGRVWGIRRDAQITDARVRFLGAAASWEPAWPYGDLSSGDYLGESTVTLRASGVLRRLDRASIPLESAIKRGMSALPGVLAYWPMEDADGSERLMPAIGERSMSISSSAVSLAGYSDAPGSAPIPTFGDGYVQGRVDTYVTASQSFRVMWYISVPAGGVGGDRQLLQLRTTGTAFEWYVTINAAGNLSVRARNLDGATVLSYGPVGFDLNGRQGLMWLELVDGSLEVLAQIGFAGSTEAAAGTYEESLMGYTKGQVTRVTLGTVGNDLSGTAMGHLLVSDGSNVPGLMNMARGYAGERAWARAERLAAEEGLALQVRSGELIDSSTPMGPQGMLSLPDLLREVADTDMGVLYEPRDSLGLVYRTRQSLYDQVPAVALDAEADHGEITHPFAPVLDDQQVRNIVTATRRGGSSYTATDDASVTALGRYEDGLEVNVATDGQLPDVAGWALHLGRHLMRYPSVAPALEVVPGLRRRWALVDVGDLVTVDNLPPQHPAGAVELLAQGFAETLTPFSWAVEANTTPGRPWRVMHLSEANTEDDTDRLDSETSTLAAGVSASATSLSVATVGPLWVQSAAHPTDFPILLDVGGEHVRATAISGTTSPQTFTVVRAVNGVSKSHAAGVRVGLARPSYLAW